MEKQGYTSKYDGDTTDSLLEYVDESKKLDVNEYVKKSKELGSNDFIEKAEELDSNAYVEAMKAQDSEGEPDTVQVYDTDGVPHKVAKAELLRKSALSLPAIEQVEKFVALNSGNEILGLMTKEQVAKALAACDSNDVDGSKLDSIRAIDGEGNPVYIKKSVFSSVLAGLIVTKENLTSESDMNNLSPGFYAYYIENGIPKNMPNAQIQRGYVVVFPDVIGIYSQIVFEWGWSSVYVRITNGGNNWKSWLKLSS